VVQDGKATMEGVPAFVPEEHVVRAVRVERRVQVDQVDAFVGDVLAQDGQVVAVEQGVLGDWLGGHGFHLDETMIPQNRGIRREPVKRVGPLPESRSRPTSTYMSRGVSPARSRA